MQSRITSAARLYKESVGICLEGIVFIPTVLERTANIMYLGGLGTLSSLPQLDQDPRSMVPYFKKVI